MPLVVIDPRPDSCGAAVAADPGPFIPRLQVQVPGRFVGAGSLGGWGWRHPLCAVRHFKAHATSAALTPVSTRSTDGKEVPPARSGPLSYGDRVHRETFA